MDFISDPALNSPQQGGFIPDPSLPHTQAATALGYTNNLLLDMAKGAYGAYANTAQGLSLGATKGALQTLNTIGDWVAKPIGQAMGVKGQIGLSNKSLQPQGTTEQIGYTGEKIGEFFLPAGAEKNIALKGGEYIDKLPEVLGLTGKAAATITGALKTALGTAITGASSAGITAAQGGDKGQIQTSAEFGAAGGTIGSLLNTFGKGLGEALQKADFKLSSSQEAKAAQKVDSAAKFMTANKILGSDQTKYRKLTSLWNTFETTLQSSLPTTVNISKKTIADNINTTVEQLKTDDPAIYSRARNQADNAIDLLNSTEGGTIKGSTTLQNALKSKRSYGQEAFKQSRVQVKDPNVVSEGSYAIEQGFQKALSDTLDSVKGTIKLPARLQQMFGGKSEVGLSDFNKVYSDVISAKSLTGLSRFKNDSGLLGRFFGLWVGETIGQTVAPGPVGKFTGAAIGEAASQRIPGMIRRVGERAVASPNAASNAVKVGLGVFNQPSGGSSSESSE